MIIMLGGTFVLAVLLVVLLVASVFKPKSKEKYSRLQRHKGNDIDAIKEQVSKDSE